MNEQSAARWGVQQHYTDALGATRSAPDAVVAAAMELLRRGEQLTGPPSGDEIVFLRQGTDRLPEVARQRRLVTESGDDLGVLPELPPDLPLGYHQLVDDETGASSLLVHHPARCYLPADLRAWGWALQLHADRSERSWGIGDLADARSIGSWSASRGGRPMLMLSPLHAPGLDSHPQPSPYFASSRCFRNPLALRIEEVAGAELCGDLIADLAARARALNDERLIDRAQVWLLKREALQLIWSSGRVESRRDEAAIAMAADPLLRAFAGFNAAAEQFGRRWADWPAELGHPAGAGWPGFHREHGDGVAFHAWMQLLVTQQLAGLGETVDVLHDLAVGTSPEGFDAWYWQELFVLDGTRIGAPADQFNTLGQDWGLPPIDPWRLRAAAYEPIVRMLRCGLAGQAGLRIDHVMGLFRLFWIPPGFGAADGVYVRQPTADLLAIIALESARSEAIVVGEDLGTVEPGVREKLAEWRLLAYRVMTLDDTAPEHLPVDSLASLTTHDLPTVAGLWTGSDVVDQQRLNLEPPVADIADARTRFAALIGVAPDASTPDAVQAAHRTLGRAASRIVMGQLEDAALVAERPNMPGTVDSWPNWSLALPQPIETILSAPATGRIADGLRAPSGLPER